MRTGSANYRHDRNAAVVSRCLPGFQNLSLNNETASKNLILSPGQNLPALGGRLSRNFERSYRASRLPHNFTPNPPYGSQQPYHPYGLPSTTSTTRRIKRCGHAGQQASCGEST